MGKVVEVVRPKPHLLKRHARALQPLLRADARIQQHGLADKIGDPQTRVHGAVGVLKHRLHFQPILPALGLGQMLDVLAPPADLAAGGLLNFQDAARGGGFAAAGLADNAEGLACADIEGDAIHCFQNHVAAIEDLATADIEPNLQLPHAQNSGVGFARL